MSEHTPGPWPEPEYDNSDTSASEWWNIPGICHIWHEPDARLIAAAPEMLDALRSCLPDLMYHKASREQVAAAIAKAGGPLKA